MTEIECDNLDETIEKYEQLGYRLDMIRPADSPREALMSTSVETVRLVLSPGFSRQKPPEGGTQNRWTKGRAGMEYRALSPRYGRSLDHAVPPEGGTQNADLIVSHIRLTQDGEVPDYVHYHKVNFQMIRCIKGRIKVVYEDQGEPFWLEPGDWVIQPPQIRHRVLYSEGNAEVIEISMPAEHETWIDHDLELPTNEFSPDRDFSGQRFVRFVARDS